MARQALVNLEYQNLIPGPPAPPEALHRQACSNDTATVDSWRPTWIEQTRQNKAHVGSFKDAGVGQLFGKHRYQPAIVAGSGPSLKVNGEQLKDRDGIPLISCLHNFHFFEDRGVRPDYYVSLDAGPVVLDEISEGGQLSAEEYWARTVEHTLIAYIGSHPDLIKKWRGKIYFFNCPVPDKTVQDELAKIEEFHTYVGTGGNVLGACLYLAKAIFGCGPIAFVGADFSFGYDYKFHGWDSKYDKTLGACIPVTDVYGIKRKTWPTYANFKAWFEYVATSVPGIYFNCTEGGCLGSYPEGNIAAFRYLDLADFFGMFQMSKHKQDQCLNPETTSRIMLF